MEGGQERQAFYLLSKGQAQGEPLRAMQMATQNVNNCGVGKLVQGEPLQYYLAAVEMHELQRVTLMCADYFFSLHTSLCTRLCHRSSVEPQGVNIHATFSGLLFRPRVQSAICATHDHDHENDIVLI